MNSKRLFLVSIAIIAALLLGFAGAFQQSTAMLKTQSEKLSDLKLTDIVLNKQKSDLDTAKRYIKEFSELEQVSKSIVPQDKDQANTIAELTSMAREADIPHVSFSFLESNLGQAGKKKNDKGPTDSNKTQVTELSDLKGVYAMAITVSNRSLNPVTYDQILRYLELLESNRRTSQVTNIEIRPDQQAQGRFHFSIILNTYIRP